MERRKRFSEERNEFDAQMSTNTGQLSRHCSDGVWGWGLLYEYDPEIVSKTFAKKVRK
jgi:hypothetical protein